MADFRTHWRVGLVTSTGGAFTLSWLKLCDPKLLPLLVLVGWVGSIIPDIDSDTSHPRRIIFDGLCFVLPPALIYRVPLLHSSPVYALLFWGGATWLILKPLKWSFRKYTKHRGVYHSVPAALIFSALCATLALHESAPKELQLSVAMIALIGYLTHLTLDEIWAVDFNGKLPSKKRSFGTTLCWRGNQPRDTIILYLTLFVFSRVYWSMWYQLPLIPSELTAIGKAWFGAFIKILSSELS